MKQNNMLAMILAGGRGSRLHDLTQKVGNRNSVSLCGNCLRVPNRLFHTAENIELLIFHSATVPTAESTLSAY